MALERLGRGGPLLGALAGADVESLRDPAFGDDEYLPLRCPRCGEPMRIIAFVLDRTANQAEIGIWRRRQGVVEGGVWE